MGHQVAVPFPEGALVGMVTDLLNNGGAIYEMGPTNSAMEEVLMARIGQMLGLPPGCGGIMCHGGTLANLVALLAARRRAGKGGLETWVSATHALTDTWQAADKAAFLHDNAAELWGLEQRSCQS